MSLPVDQVLPRLCELLGRHQAVVLQAPPGAGKTTRVPLELLKAPFLRDSRIIILEPRRLAAVNAARWMAASLGEAVGETVGYTIRFEKKVSKRTRIEVITEGILSRRLQLDPALSGVGCVIFDEFHERSIHTDLALALCRDVQLALRDDLRILVMSATLDAAPAAALLGEAPVVTSEGQMFPVEVRYLPRDLPGDPALQAAAAVAKAVAETEGDILVFLPGGGEIRRCQRELQGRPELTRLLICPLYGDLPFAAQERAIQPAERRKVVLATNIAETSLTIEGVTVVVDSGWYRRLRYDPASGLEKLVTERISAASAVQRTGRAGRLGPGYCYRLWSEHTQQALIPYQPPEICTADLASLALELANWGVADPSVLAWLDPPPAAPLAEARRLLARLGALDERGRITSEGKRLAQLPLHPRLAHLLVVAEADGSGYLGCDLAALLSERDLARGGVGETGRSRSDLLDRLELLHEWRRGAGRHGENDGAACVVVDRTARQLRRFLQKSGRDEAWSAEEVGLLLAVAFPDRLARQREEGSRRYLLANGRGARLSERSAVFDEPFLVAVTVDGGEGGDSEIRLASAVSREELRRHFAPHLTRERVVMWDQREGRVIAVEEERLDALVLSVRPLTPTGEEISRALLKGIIAGPGLAALSWTPAAEQFLARVRFLHRISPNDWPDLSPAYLSGHIEEWLGSAVRGVRSLEQVAKVDISPPLCSLLSPEQARNLERGAPGHIEVPSGSTLKIDYLPEEGPVLAVKLQELFGLAVTPTVAWGRVPLVLHLLSPAGRPIQVTKDLKSFWNSGYLEVKKELKGRYPKHPWPDDPWSARPTRHTKNRAG